VQHLVRSCAAHASEEITMRAQLVLTLIGPDRPGLVELVSDAIANAGGNWEQSRMAQLDDKFAGILRISLPRERAEELKANLLGLERNGLRVVVEAASTAAPQHATRGMRLELVGNDREGIVRDISRALSRQGVNVDELHTQCEDAPMGGGRVFRAWASLRVPGEVSVGELAATLEAIADDLLADVTLSEASASGSRS
jgi:glycine cleavage system regulatory protein